MKYFLVVLTTIMTINMYAQNCDSSLSGVLFDRESHLPIASAKIQIVGTNQVTYTDFNGKYTFDNLCDKSIEIKVIADEAKEQIIPVLIEGKTKQNIHLENQPEKLSDVLIIGKSAVRTSKTAQEQSISGEDIDKFSSQSIGDALKQISGVSTLNTGKSIVKPVVQGLSGSRVPILNNGVRMEDQEWGVDHAPNIDLNSAGKLTVVKGAAALQYGGDAIGGIVIADKATIPRKDTIYGKTILSGSTNGRGGSITSSLTKSFKSGLYFNAQGTYKNFGDYEAPDYILSNTGTNERSFSANIGLNEIDYGFDAYYSKFNNHLAILRASSTGSVADLVNAINSDRPIYEAGFTRKQEAPRQKIDHQLARLKLYKIFDGFGKLDLSYSYQENNRLEYDIRRGDNKYKPSVDLNLKTHAAKFNFDFNTRNDRGLNVGADWDYKNNFANPETGVRRIIPDYKSFHIGTFATGFYNLGDNWQAEAGLRYDYTHIDAKKYYNKFRWSEKNYDEDFSDIIIGDFGSQYLVEPILHYDNLSANAGVKYDLHKDYVLRFNYALGNRAPNPAELFSDGLHHSSASLELGDLRIGSEQSNNISLSFEKQRGDFTFTVAPYINIIRNYINEEPTGLEETVRGVFLKYEYQQNDAQLLGLDVDAAYQINDHFSYRGKFSTVDGREIDSHRALIDIPATNMSHAVSYQNEKWHHLTLTLKGDAVFKKQNYPDDNFTIKVLDNGVYENQLVDISTPPSGYFLTGFDASAVFHPFKRGAMEVGLSLSNIFNVKYRDYLNKLRYYADNTGRNISLQVKFKY